MNGQVEAPQPICSCRQDPNADGSPCEDCGHHASMHVAGSGCVEGADAPQLKPGKCGCDRKPGPTSGIICPSCEHSFGLHDRDAGCVDGIDHPGSVGPMSSELPFMGAHGPSAEQWARGMAMLITALVAKGTGAPSDWRNQAQTVAELIDFILNGEDG